MAPGKSLDNELSHDEKAVAAVSQQLEKPTRNGIVKHEGDLDFDSIEDAISAFSEYCPFGNPRFEVLIKY